jgi:hypothetical protein
MRQRRACVKQPTPILLVNGGHRLEWMVKSGGIDVVLAGLRDNTTRFPWPDPAWRAL